MDAQQRPQRAQDAARWERAWERSEAERADQCGGRRGAVERVVGFLRIGF